MLRSEKEGYHQDLVDAIGGAQSPTDSSLDWVTNHNILLISWSALVHGLRGPFSMIMQSSHCDKGILSSGRDAGHIKEVVYFVSVSLAHLLRTSSLEQNTSPIIMKGLFLVGASALVSSAAARTFTMFTDLNVAPNVPNFQTGWEAGAFTKVSFTVPNNWKAGRIWARRDCNFATNPGPNSCLDGGCNGGLLCDPHTGTGVPPATVAEWTLEGDGNRDFYDVSLVDGYNLPARIDNNKGCPVADCPVDLGPNCPPQLKGPFDSTGFPVGCRSACQANLDGNPSCQFRQLLLWLAQYPRDLPEFWSALVMSSLAPTDLRVANLAMKATVISTVFTLVTGTAARTFTLFTDLNVAPNVPAYTTGWEAKAYTKVSFTVPDNWKAGRIWGRRNCDFTTNPGPNSCMTGGCNGGLHCDTRTGTGVPPATVAEWTLEANGNQDYYDVSLVDGYNLPMRISNNKGCPVADCPVDLGPKCESAILRLESNMCSRFGQILLGPSALKGPFDSSGFPVGCKSACFANLDGNQGNSANCCSGSHSTPATCPTSGVAYYSYFKSNCPKAYAYAYDESSGTALWTCPSSLKADYTLTFCP
ncbi:hypothetical protein CVT25_008978 [Psilocybe cyanescens]|uniref:Thaumatin-like protein n=1 Tax=Psilocybe cyanescens TaxID=93625 RepID=A0A409XN91_PSICY|nr:hypothetical protein CVT25_008978 [Psilocybe cyanescens]